LAVTVAVRNLDGRQLGAWLIGAGYVIVNEVALTPGAPNTVEAIGALIIPRPAHRLPIDFPSFEARSQAKCCPSGSKRHP
jgi:hypothetical protein